MLLTMLAIIGCAKTTVSEVYAGDDDEDLAPDWHIGSDDGADDDGGGFRHRWTRGKWRGYRR
jgi:hypothetical protein